MGEERRDFVRLAKRIKVEYRVIVDTYANESVPPNVSYTETISGNGMLMLSSKVIKNGTRFEMEIFINDGSDDSIEAVGEVIGNNAISSDEFEIKIRFTDIDEPVRDRLSSYIIREDVKKKK